MSRTIDERVVSMQFDNRNFENNVKTSMGTLERLKQSLNLKGASKGFDELSTAAKRVDLNPISRGVEQVGVKFSAMQTVAFTVLQNITNEAYAAGKRIATALTIDPIKTGFQEYETQINAVQTILSNTQSKGSTLEDVNRILDELNEYADQTIYNFTEMTRNIGTFTAAGVELETSATAIKGIANLAAMSGSTSQQASTAMYQLSQALASGTIRLMDWNSVVNAGMGGQVFQDALKQTARNHGIAIDSIIEKNGSFRESLREEWLTAEILTETLSHFTMAAEEGSEEWNSLKQSLMDDGYTAAQAEEILKLGNNATDAATKVKTFTQMWEVLKESAQSGWAQTWRIIFGDFEEARSLFTPLTNFFTGIIDKMSDARNAFVRMVLDSPVTGLIETVQGITAATKGAIDTMKDLGDVVDRVIRGDFGNQGDQGNANYRRDRLSEAGYNYAQVQNLVNERLGCSVRLTEDLEETQNGLNEAQATNIETMAEMSKEQLREIGLTGRQITALKQLQEISEKTGVSIKDILNDPESVSGRSLLINAFANLGNMLKEVASIAKKAWKDIFDPIGPKVAQALYDLIASFHKLSLEFELDSETANDLRRTFKGLFAALEIIWKLSTGPLKVAWNVLTNILSLFNLDILDFTAGVGDAIVAIRDWINEHSILKNIIETVQPFIQKCVDAIRGWYQENESLFSAIGDRISEIVSKLSAKIGEWKQVGGFLVEGFAEGFWEGAKRVFSTVLEFASRVLDIVCNEWLVFSPSRKAIEIGGYFMEGFVVGILEGAKALFAIIRNVFSTVVDTVGGFFGNLNFEPIKNFFGNLGDFFGTVFGKIKETMTNADWQSIFSAALGTSTLIIFYKFVNALEALTEPLEGVGDFMSRAGTGVKRFLTGLSKNLKAEAFKKNATAILILAGALAVLVLALGGLVWLVENHGESLMKSVVALGVLAVILGVLAIAVSKLGSATFSLKKGEGLSGTGSGVMMIIGIAAAMLIMAKSLKELAAIDADKVPQVVGLLVDILLSLGILCVAISSITKYNGAEKSAMSAGLMLVGIGVAFWLMTKAISSIAKLSEDDIFKGVAVISALTILFVALIAVSHLAGEHADKAGKMMIKLSIAMLLMAYVIRSFAKIKPEDALYGLTIIGILELMVTGLIAVSKLAGEHADKAGKMLLKLSVALLVMAYTIKVIAGISTNDLTKGISVIATLGILMGGLMVLTHYFGSGDAAKLGVMLISFSASLLILVGVIWLIGLMETSQLVKGLSCVVLLGLMVAALVKSTEKAQNVKGTLIALVAAIGLLVVSVIILSMLDERRLAVAVGALMGVLGAFALVIHTTKSLENVKWGTLATMAGMLLVLVGALWLLSTVPDTNALVKSAVGIATVLIALGVAMKLMNKVAIDKNAVGGIILMTGVIYLLAFVLGIMSELGVQNSISNAVALGILANALATSMFIFSKSGAITPRAMKALAEMGVIVGILGLVLKVMSGTQGAIPNAIALGILANLLATSMIILGKAKDGSTKALGSLMVMSGCMIFMGMILTLMDGVQGAIPNAIALGILANALSVAMIILGKACGITPNSLKALLTMSLCMVPLGLVLKAMSGVEGAIQNAVALGILANALAAAMVILRFSKDVAPSALAALMVMSGCMIFLGMILTAMDGVQNAISNAIALSILANALSVAMIILGVVGKFGMSAVIGVGLLLLMAVPLLAFVGVLALMQNVNKAAENVNILIKLALALTLLLVPLTIIGVFAYPALIGVGLLTLMAVPLLAFVGVLAVMQNIQNAKANTNLLIGLMSALTTMLIKISLVAPLALIGVTAMYGLIGLVGVIGTLVTALGFLMEKFPALETFLDKGIPVLAKIGEAIGGFIGSFVAGIAGAIADELPHIGTKLSEFYANAEPFITGVSTIDGGAVLKGIGALGAAIVALTAADFLNGLLNLRDTDGFASLGTQLSMFMLNAMPFIIGARMVTEEAATGAQALAKTIMILTAADFLDGIKNWLGLGDDNPLAGFAEQLVPFGQGLVRYANVVSNIDEAGLEAMKVSAEAGKTLAEMADSVPNFGGKWAEFWGDNELDDFGLQLSNFGRSLVKYGESVADLNVEAVETSTPAVKALAEIADNLPNSGGWAATILGDNAMDDFGERLKQFGWDLFWYGEYVDGLKVGAIDLSVGATTSLSEMADALPDSGGLKASILGDNAIDDFGTRLKDYGTSLKSYGENVNGLDINAISTSVEATKMLNDMTKVLPDPTFWENLTDTSIETFGKKLKKLGESLAKYGEKVAGIDTGQMASSTTQLQRLINLVKGVEGVDFDGITSFSDSLGEIGVEGVKAFIKAFDDSAAKVEHAGAKMINSLKTGMTKNANTVKQAAQTLCESTRNVLRSFYQPFKEMGRYLVQGFAAGITAETWRAEARSAAMARAAETAAREELDINSPSKVFRRIGFSVPEGFAQGIDMMAGMAADSARAMADGTLDTVSGSIARIAEAVNSDIDSQPTIRPVLDLSDVTSGASRISDMLNLTPSMGVLANVGSISSMMNRNQNGTNNDVISAIKDLGRRIGESSGDTYSINGVTYDDGSNIKDAVQTIVRAARMERRM